MATKRNQKNDQMAKCENNIIKKMRKLRGNGNEEISLLRFSKKKSP